MIRIMIGTFYFFLLFDVVRLSTEQECKLSKPINQPGRHHHQSCVGVGNWGKYIFQPPFLLSLSWIIFHTRLERKNLHETERERE